MKEGTKIFERDMKVSETVRTRTERNNELKDETRVMFEGAGVVLALANPGGYDLNDFVAGMNVRAVIIRA